MNQLILLFFSHFVTSCSTLAISAFTLSSALGSTASAAFSLVSVTFPLIH